MFLLPTRGAVTRYMINRSQGEQWINQQADAEIPTSNFDPAHLSVVSVSSRSEPFGGKGYRSATRTMLHPHNGLTDAGAILAFLTQTV